MSELVPCLKFPTTLVFVDDDLEFLNNLELVLAEEYKYKSFPSAKEALTFIKSQDEKWREFIKKYLSLNLEDTEILKPKASLSIADIHHILYDASRFNLSSVMVTDFAMPDMSGIELCENLKIYLIKNIMLTGEAGYDLAVSGFNRGFLDQFILKSETDFLTKIKQSAANLEAELFVDISKNLYEVMCGSLEESIFSDPAFIQFFEDLVRKFNIVEYYLLDTSGSYVLLNAEGKIHWLIVKNERDMKMMQEIAEEETKNKALIDAIEKREKLALLLNPDKQLLSPKTWRLEKVQLLQGKEKYYYSLVEGTDEYYKLETDRIVPYLDHIR
jgi:CheY-like chemotaxis protein